MTTVIFDIKVDDAGEELVPAVGSLVILPLAPGIDGGALILAVAFTAPLVDGKATAVLRPGDYSIEERIAGGSTRRITVPDSVAPVAYSSLLDLGA